MNRSTLIKSPYGLHAGIARVAFLLLGVYSHAAAGIVIDFRHPETVEIQGRQSQVTAIDKGLEVRTQAGAAYPGIWLEKKDKKPWDLKAFGGVEALVYNPDDQPLRVLLSINNSGADGRRHCNTESGVIPPRGRGVVKVPFGMWHGDPGHPIDTGKIVSFMVFLDKPDRARSFRVEQLQTFQVVKEAVLDPALLKGDYYKNLQPFFGRGVNLGNALEAPTEGAWGIRLEQEYFERIKEAGFDSVRLPVRWSAHAGQEPPYQIDPVFLKRVDWAVDQALDRGLKVMLNMHHYDELMADPPRHRERFIALWKQLAAHYRNRPETLAFELLNEPHQQFNHGHWNELIADTLAVIRPTHPQRWIVVGPAHWNGIKDLPLLRLPEDDRRLVVSVHYYLPFHFTHQGASWAGAHSKEWLGTRWEGSPAEQAIIRRDFDKALAWGLQQRRPMHLGEFGAYEKADMESRVRWTRFVAREARARKMGSAYWEFCAGFGIYDPKTRRFREGLKNALLAR